MANVQDGTSRALSSDMGDEKADAFLDLARRAVKKMDNADGPNPLSRTHRGRGEPSSASNRSRRVLAGVSTVAAGGWEAGGGGEGRVVAPRHSEEDLANSLSRAGTAEGAALRRPEPPSCLQPCGLPEQFLGLTSLPEPSSCPESGETPYICDKGRLKFLPRPPVSAEERLRWLDDDEGASGRRQRLSTGRPEPRGEDTDRGARRSNTREPARDDRQPEGRNRDGRDDRRAHCKAPSGEEAQASLKLGTSSPVPIWENLRWLDEPCRHEAPCGRKARQSFVPKFLKRLWTGRKAGPPNHHDDKVDSDQ